MRASIDRTNDGLSWMPADGISLPPKGDFGTSRGAARRLGYINGATGRKGIMTATGTNLPIRNVRHTAAFGGVISTDRRNTF
jgi:hypothetical protein